MQIPKSSDHPAPPPWLRVLFRAPAFAYRVGVGWMFGGRLVLIEHTGRRTGNPHRVVVEVVARDRDTGTITVASGYGPGADWYRNLLAHPRTHVVVRRQRLPVRAQRVPAEVGAQLMTEYARSHRRAARRVVRMLGYPVNGKDVDFTEIGRTMPFLRLAPDPEDQAPRKADNAPVP